MREEVISVTYSASCCENGRDDGWWRAKWDLVSIQLPNQVEEEGGVEKMLMDTSASTKMKLKTMKFWWF